MSRESPAAVRRCHWPSPTAATAAAFTKDWGEKDAARIAAHYTDDGNVMVPNFPVMTGKSSIENAMKEVLADPNWSLTLPVTQVEVSKSGDLGYARGTYVQHRKRSSQQEIDDRKGAVSDRISQGNGRSGKQCRI